MPALPRRAWRVGHLRLVGDGPAQPLACLARPAGGEWMYRLRTSV